ncbi:GNAT family N-acetyltransferase [uncultured Pelagimonas sp.]|uniref:GNAT family N-acetyltransferase n=1 Tax=uncultured Pelagimonas sp. TaxID=1618102 RepID=UPI00262000F0|nr:GNAT family N-acetyltransferase [uncultured Pelagimonas sp.]
MNIATYVNRLVAGPKRVSNSKLASLAPAKRDIKTMIRPYHPTSDDDAIVDIYLAASRQAHSFLSEEFWAKEAINVREIYLPNAETYVATQDDIVTGFIALLGTEVGGFFVNPERQSAGQGRALLAHALSKHPVLELDVFKDNPIGRRFYARFGFEELGERFDDYTQQQVIRLRYDSTTL